MRFANWQRCLFGSFRRTGAGLLGDTGAFACEAAQVIQLGAANLALAPDFDGVQRRGVQREDALDAFTEGEFPDREILVHARARAGDAEAFKGLDALALAFLDLHVDAQRVAGLEIRDFLAFGDAGDFLGFEDLDEMSGHGYCLSVARFCPRTLLWRGIPGSGV